MNEETAAGAESQAPLTLTDWARTREPRLYVSARSEPEPVLLQHNLIAAVRDPDVSRELLRKWERIQEAAAGVGFVAMSRSPRPDGRPPYTRPEPVEGSKGDPQKVAGHAVRRIVRGAVPGGLIGAIVIGVIAAILTPDGGNVTAAALGGAAFGFMAGAVISFVAGSGWSEAYKESFVEPETTEVTYASIHSDDVDLVRRAAKVADVPGGTLLSVDRGGRSVPLDEPTSH
jgi:hypothetical protein